MKKAEYMGRDTIALKIHAAKDPSLQKKLGNAIQGNLNAWYKSAADIVLPAISAKFHQNPQLATHLTNTGKRTISEATVDKFWGNGIQLNNMNIFDQNQWKGDNVMGNLLMKIRSELTSIQ